MHVVGEWSITNISDYPVQLLAVRLPAHATEGGFVERELIQPRDTIHVKPMFWIETPTLAPGRDLIADVDFIDNFCNRHRDRRVRFRHQA